tara:strand:- start:89 stop:1186 length:1098 start_codon:yes stop_codon:yes gene_type:complete
MSLSKIKKISFLIYSFEYGGAEKNMILLANLFFKKGYNVDVIVINNKGGLNQNLEKGVTTINFNKKKSILCIFKLIKYFNVDKPDYLFSSIIHLNLISIFCSLVSWKKVNIIIRESNIILDSYNLKSKIKNFIFVNLAKFLYKKSFKIIAISDAVKNNLTVKFKINKNKINKINNPVDIKNIQIKSKEKIEHKYFNNKDKIILTVASLTKQKNLQLLIKAFNRVIREIPTKLIIIGTGTEYSYLKKLTYELKLDKYVDFLGNIQNPYPYMKQCDLFVLPSLYEGLPNVLIEALVCESHILATNCPGGSSEILQKYGKLVKCNDLNDLTIEITSFLKKNKKNKNINSRYLNFSIENQFKKYENLIS